MKRYRNGSHYLSEYLVPRVLQLLVKEVPETMEITLNRTSFDCVCTQGSLSIDGQPQCCTLELPNKDGLPGSCIPQGRYKVVLAPSPKFQASTNPWVQTYAGQMPHLEGIPGRSLIMIHWGNSACDTEGCILVGQSPSQDYISDSRDAFKALYDKIQPAASDDSEDGGCWISVVGGASVDAAAAATAASSAT